VIRFQDQTFNFCGQMTLTQGSGPGLKKSHLVRPPLKYNRPSFHACFVIHSLPSYKPNNGFVTSPRFYIFIHIFCWRASDMEINMENGLTVFVFLNDGLSKRENLMKLDLYWCIKQIISDFRVIQNLIRSVSFNIRNWNVGWFYLKSHDSNRTLVLA